MSDVLDNPRAVIGDNLPPSPLDDARSRVDDLYAEAKNWLDGSRIENPEQAETLGKLYTDLDDASKLAEKTRKAEKQPHLDAGKAVDEAWKPVVDKAEKARTAVKRTIQIWNDELDRRQRAEAERVRKEAEEAAARAHAEHEAAHRAGNLDALEAADEQIANAEELARMASRAEAAKPVTATGGARGIGKAPKRFTGRLSDAPTAANDLARHYWQTRRAEVVAFYLNLAAKDIRAGARILPGMIIEEEKLI